MTDDTAAPFGGDDTDAIGFDSDVDTDSDSDTDLDTDTDTDLGTDSDSDIDTEAPSASEGSTTLSASDISGEMGGFRCDGSGNTTSSLWVAGLVMLWLRRSWRSACCSS